MTTPSPKVWIGCLASYNAGRLYGEWFEMDTYADADDFKGAVAEFLKRSTAENAGLHYPGWVAEEFHVCDSEEFKPFEIGQYESLDEIWFKASVLTDEAEYGVDADVIAAAAATFGEKYVLEGIKRDSSWVADRFLGSFENSGEFAEEMHGDEYKDSVIAPYIDWDAFERDLEMNGDISSVRGEDGPLYFFNKC